MIAGRSSQRREIPSPVARATAASTVNSKANVYSLDMITENGSNARGNRIERIKP